MDTRAAGISLKESARELDNYNHKEQAYLKFSEALAMFQLIRPLTHQDYKEIISIYHRMANIHFYFNRYPSAITFYQLGIAQYMHFIPDDNDYRELIGLNIDLGDSLMELAKRDSVNGEHYKQLAAQEPAKVIDAFNHIRNKTPQEIAIGNPEVNYARLRHFFEKKLSAPSYLQSRGFQTNQQQLLQTYDQNRIDDIGDLMSGVALNHSASTPSQVNPFALFSHANSTFTSTPAPASAPSTPHIPSGF